MPVPAVQYTPVTPRRGGGVHATTLAAPQRTACGRKFRAWVVSLKRVDCDGCKLAVGIPVKKRRRTAGKP